MPKLQVIWKDGQRVLKCLLEKGRIVHFGSEDGFLRKGLLTFKSNKTGDYHEDMNANVFEDYFEKMLKYLGTGSVVVMDNTSYHSRWVDSRCRFCLQENKKLVTSLPARMFHFKQI